MSIMFSSEHLEHFGFRVLRFWYTDVFLRFEEMLEQVRLCQGKII